MNDEGLKMLRNWLILIAIILAAGIVLEAMIQA